MDRERAGADRRDRGLKPRGPLWGWLVRARGVALFALFCLPLGLASEVRAEPKGPTLADARAQAKEGNHEAAIETLEALLENEPKNGVAWSLLGSSHHALGQLEDALPAYLKATRFPQVAPTALYNAACVYARLGEPRKSIQFLQRAEATGAIDLRQAETDPDFASIRDRAEFRDLRPTREQFADPFVEKVRVLQEWSGKPLSQFGWIARNIGDVDGDGKEDVTTSAPTLPTTGPSAGCVYVYSSKSGKLLWKREGNPGDTLGIGIEAAGDTNGDGIPDVIAGAPGRGKAYLYSGESGKVLHTLSGPVASGFGSNVSDVGDVNGDGADDVLVGAPRDSTGGQTAGRVVLFSGKTGEPLVTLDGEGAGHRFGSALGGGIRGKESFLVIGAPGAGAKRTGRTYVYSGRGEKRFAIENDGTGAQLGGMFVSVVGDVNGDDVLDVYASDWSNGAKGQSTGRIFVHSGKTGERLLVLTGEVAGDGFGIGSADAGDVDGDGCDDLIVGAWQHASAARSGGKCYLYSGKSGTLIREITCKVPGETFGFDATGLGDVDGDGKIDFLLTSAWSGVQGSRSGRVFVIAGEGKTTLPSVRQSGR